MGARGVALLCVLLAAAACFVPPAFAANTVILVSIDGFRADYLERGITPNLLRLSREGVRATAMEPVFPSLTYPNHYSIVTGLYPDHHGIVGNSMRDPEMPGHLFALSNRAELAVPRWWEGAIPIWETLHRHGLKSATVFWPGSETVIHGVQPDFWMPFDHRVTIDARVDKVLELLSRPEAERPVFLTLYFDSVDHQGHVAGPESREVDDAMAQVDAGLGRLFAALRERGLAERTDLVIVSDHGMAGTSPDRMVSLDDYTDASGFDSINSGAVAGIYPRPGAERAIARDLVERPLPHANCWAAHDIPARLHYGANPRVAPYFCVAEVGWLLKTHDARPIVVKGMHGYDPATPSMAALFVASGPAFKPGVVIPRLRVVDVYPLLAKLLGVPPEPNDGSIDPLLPALR